MRRSLEEPKRRLRLNLRKRNESIRKRLRDSMRFRERRSKR